MSTIAPHAHASRLSMIEPHSWGNSSAANPPRPWEDTTLSPQERYDCYRELVRSQCKAILVASERSGITPAERRALKDEPATQFWAAELKQINQESPEQFCKRIETRLETIDGHTAVVGKTVGLNGLLVTMLSSGSFNKTRAEQITYARKLGFRIASHSENIGYLHSLKNKEKDGSINEAEETALWVYRNKVVRDSFRSVTLKGHILDSSSWDGEGGALYEMGALFVREG